MCCQRMNGHEGDHAYGIMKWTNKSEENMSGTNGNGSETTYDILNNLIGLAKAGRIQRLRVGEIELEFCADAFKPPAVTAEPPTPEQREKAEKKHQEMRKYGSSVG